MNVRLLIAALLLLLSHGAQAQRPQQCPPQAAPPTADQLAAATAKATDRGLLWRVRRDGHDSYVYGTLHVGRLAWAPPGPALRQAWRDTDTLAVELDIGDPQTLRALTQDVPPAAPLGAALQRRLAAQTAAACLPPEALSTLHPLMQAVTLAMLAGRWDELDAGYAQEQVLLGLARGESRRIVALEDAREQLAALIPSDPQEQRRTIAETLDQLEKNEVRAPMLKLATAWSRSDIALLENYEHWCDCIHGEADRRYLRGLLDERNPRLAERLAAQHAQGRRVFAAVGALHLTGPRGVPALLKKMGFEVERLLPPPSASP